MSRNLRLSVIVPTFNRPNSITNLIRALLPQRAHIGEIIIIDQGSAASPIYQELAEEQKNGWLSVIKQAVPSAARARNTGVRMAKYPIVLVLDDDIEIENDFVLRHIQNYSDPRVGAVQGAVIQPGRAMDAYIPYTFYLPYIGFAHFPLHHKQNRDGIANLPSGNMSIYRDYYLQIGGFDEQFEHLLFDDTDFSVRAWLVLQRAGKVIRHDAHAVARHLMTDEGRTRHGGMAEGVRLMSSHKQWDMIFYFYLKNFGWQGSWRELAVLLRLNLLRKPYFFKPAELLAAYREIRCGYNAARNRLREGMRLMPECPAPLETGDLQNRDAYFWMSKEERSAARRRNYGGVIYTLRRMFQPGVDFEKTQC